MEVLDRRTRVLLLEPAELAAGSTVRVRIRPPAQLGNSGGLITLLSPAGLKVDGVADRMYQSHRAGWTISV
ncbi:MAG TPA: hypothetical protein VIJ23_13440 [Mycobacterium sp.]